MSSFDFLAHHYNAMTGFPGRIDALAASIRPWLEAWRVKTALDAGCGGGALMFALDNCGVTPVGLDLSEPMLRLAIQNARERSKSFCFHGAPHASAGAIHPGAFDAVFCLGNAIIGEHDDRSMIESLSGLCRSLRPGGHILIQILNLTPFFLGLKTVIARRSLDGREYLRFATPQKDQLTFCALVLGPASEVDVHTSTWGRWERVRLLSCVSEAGFEDVATYGAIDKSPFDPRQSTDLVVVARSAV